MTIPTNSAVADVIEDVLREVVHHSVKAEKFMLWCAIEGAHAPAHTSAGNQQLQQRIARFAVTANPEVATCTGVSIRDGSGSTMVQSGAGGDGSRAGGRTRAPWLVSVNLPKGRDAWPPSGRRNVRSCSRLFPRDALGDKLTYVRLPAKADLMKCGMHLPMNAA